MNRLHRMPLLGTILLATFLSAGKPHDTLPVYLIEPVSEDLQTKECSDWGAIEVVKPAWSWMEPFFFGRALAASGGACEKIIKCTGEKWGALDSDGKWIVQPVWDRIRMTWPHVGFEVDLDDRKGVLDAAGKPRVPVAYSTINVDEHGFAHVMNVDGKFEVFNPEGKRILWGVEFTTGAGPSRVWVNRGSRWALYDRDGKQATPLRYSETSPSDGPIYPVRVGKRWGLIDARGKQLAPFSYGGISFLIGRLLPVNVGGTCDVGMMKCSGGRVGVLNLQGKLILPARYACADTTDGEDGSSEIRAMEVPAKSAPGDPPCTGGLWRIFDGAGRPMSPDSYAYIELFHGARTTRAVKDGRCTDKGVCSVGKWGLVDRVGKVFVPFRYDWIDLPDDENGTAFVLGGKWGFLDARGRVAAAAKYEMIDVDEGAVRFRAAGKWGVMDPSGKVLVPASHDRILPFREKVARFSDHGRWGLLSIDGKVIVPAVNSVLCQQSHRTYAFSRSPGCSVPVSRHAWNRITPTGGAPIQREGRADDECVCKGVRFGLMDLAGRELFAPKYEQIDVISALRVSEAVAKASSAAHPVPMPPGEVWVRINQGGACDGEQCKGGRWGLFDLRGRTLIPVKYAFLAPDTDFRVRVAEGGTCDGGWFPSRCGPQTKWGLMKLSPVVK